MRRSLILALIVIFMDGNVWAQKQTLMQKTDAIESVNIASADVKKLFIPPPKFQSVLKSGQVSDALFEVEFDEMPEAAKSAFVYATTIYQQLISTSVPIKIKVMWEPVEGTILSKCRPSAFYKNFDEALVRDVYYPIALYEKLSGKNQNGAEADILCTFNKNTNWYFGTDGDTPTNKFDFVTAALHEIIHGLGFSGFMKAENEMGFFNNSSNLPSIFDYHIYNHSFQQLADHSTFTSPSKKLFNEMTSENLMFYCPGNLKSANLATDIYAPHTWKEGSSIYHLNKYDDQGHSNLMSPKAFNGEAVHHPGEQTLKMLWEMGWKTVLFQFDEIKDFETACEKLPVNIQLNSDFELDSSSVKIVFSTNYFTSQDSATLHFNKSKNCFEGDIPLNYHQGKLQYYFKTQTANNCVFQYPPRASNKKFSLRIGPDYYPPSLKHNEQKMMSGSNPSLHFSALATDNLGVESVKVEYNINGISQEPVELKSFGFDFYNIDLKLPEQLTENDVVEYRIVAQDQSSKSNKKYLPSNGFYRVDVFDCKVPVRGYVSDFNSPNSDFVFSDFEIGCPVGFSNNNLHSVNPYPKSELENEKVNLIAQLKHPVIIEESGQMSFDEVVLVEPASAGTDFMQEMFWDFVVVEGSKNGGKNWYPFTDGYDSGINKTWYAEFTNTLKSNNSQACGNENLFWTNTINLTENEFFDAGDTVLFRFRLASDKSVTGWGWAIDNLQIQSATTRAEQICKVETKIFPNPFSSLVNIQVPENNGTLNFTVFDISGKPVFQKQLTDNTEQIGFSGFTPGFYLFEISANKNILIRKKMIKR